MFNDGRGRIGFAVIVRLTFGRFLPGLICSFCQPARLASFFFQKGVLSIFEELEPGLKNPPAKAFLHSKDFQPNRASVLEAIRQWEY